MWHNVGYRTNARLEVLLFGNDRVSVLFETRKHGKQLVRDGDEKNVAKEWSHKREEIQHMLSRSCLSVVRSHTNGSHQRDKSQETQRTYVM